MSTRLRTKLGIGAVLGLAVVTALTAFLTHGGRLSRSSRPKQEFNESTPLTVLATATRESDARALAVLLQKLTPSNEQPLPALTDVEGAEWIEVLNSLRTGYLKFGSHGKAVAVTVASRAFQRFSIDPGPAQWVKALWPTHDVLTAGLSDIDLEVRVTSLVEVGKLWSWIPGRTATQTEEYTVANWKDSFVAPVVRRLSDGEDKARAAAVSCLGYHPIDGAAGPAVAYLEDAKSADVRKQVLLSYVMRPSLLTEDMILKHVFDQDRGVAETAGLVLKTRGLTQEQISLGSMIFHPRAEMRSSVIPLLKERTDIDPAVWLIQLSQDPEESVRISAIEALSTTKGPEIEKRIAEMAATDKSANVRRAASKYLLPEVEKTAGLPPLPGSPSLNPKAN